jgi:hypothetical protein
MIHQMFKALEEPRHAQLQKILMAHQPVLCVLLVKLQMVRLQQITRPILSCLLLAA